MRFRAFCTKKSDKPFDWIELSRYLPGKIAVLPSSIANIRNQMRLFSILASGLLVTSALCQTAIAQTPDCKSIADPAARLACFDKGTPAAASAAARPARAAPSSKADGTQYVDSISAEDAIMNAKIKGICHGC